GRDGEPCPRCAAPLIRWTQGGRSTYGCLACQREGA
ncbi:MAG: zinc finger domain-containing protein, partial [Myxococcota bacterium]